jgi:hypothetical protein
MPRLRTLALLALIALAVVACGASKASATPYTSPTTSLIPPVTSGPSDLPSGSPATGQTDTEWGRIWDSLPAGFPAVAGSKASEEAATGPASATLVADGEVLIDGEDAEYRGLYRRLVELTATGTSDVDLAPLRLVADAFLLGRRRTVEPFED